MKIIAAGQKLDDYFNAQGQGGNNTSQTINTVSTQSAADIHAKTGADLIYSTSLAINNTGLTGGSNEYPRNLQGTVPYFKTTYSAEQINDVYSTPGQHVGVSHQQTCYGVGDCLIGSQYLVSSGGFRDLGDEGTHRYDILTQEDAVVFEGTCAGGCAPGATTVQITPTANAGTQGEGRYLIDTTPGKVITTGTLTGGVVLGRQPAASFAGTSFPVSTLLESSQPVPSQPSQVAPGTVTVGIVTSGVPAGFASSTAALAAGTGVACISDVQQSDGRPLNFETAAYTVVDGSDLQLTFRRPHAAGATIAVGGLCGYGIEQKVDTQAGIRQVFPVIASTSPTSLLYAGGQTSILGQQGLTSAYANINLVVASISRTANVVTVTVAGGLIDVNGLVMTVQGVTDSSYNGNFTVTTTASNQLTYTDNGPDSTSSGGTLTFLTGSYALYPMAEVTGVYNAATKAVDGQMQLAANTVNWAQGDSVEEPHYFQSDVHADTESVTQFIPRPNRRQSAGVSYMQTAAPGLVGFEIENAVPATQYFGNGGTHQAPDTGLSIAGAWTDTLSVQAGEQNAFHVRCNSHGCNQWDSAYNLFRLDTGVGADTLNYSPQTSTLAYTLRGTGYSFTPQAFTAGTINVQTLNAGAIHGLFLGLVPAASLPVFAAGSAHSVGAVPDPGASAGVTRFLREDGAWSYPTGSAVVAGTGGYAVNGPHDLPQRANLLGEYLLTEGAGTVAHDTSGHGNDGVINGPSWDGSGQGAGLDLNFTAQGQFVQLPTAINGARAWQFAIYAPVLGTAALPQAPGYGQSAGFPVNGSLLCGTDGGHLCLIAGFSGGKSMQFQAFNTDATESAEPLAPGWHIFTLLCGSNVAGVVAKTHYLFDGAEVGGYLRQGDASTCPVPVGGNYQIGGSSLYTQTWWLGKVAAAWAWSTPLSLGEGASAAQSALAYLKAKGVQTEFKAVPQPAPVVVAGLDSRTYGIGVTPQTAWPAMMLLTDSTYVRVNLGNPGETVADGCNQFELTYGEQLGKRSGPAIVVLWGGVNDFILYGQTPRQIANSLRCMVQKARAAGARVVLATEVSCSTGTACDTARDGLNTILRAEAFAWGIDNLADLATDPHLGPDGASANTACFPDNLHPGPNCEPYVTAVMQNAVNELLGATVTQHHASTAASYQELAGDRYLDLTGSSAQTVTLPDCTGYSLPRAVLNLGTAAATLEPVSGQTLLGPAALAAGTRAVLLPVPGAPAAGGCKWERTQ